MGRSWTERTVRLRADTYALYLACRDPRVGWLPRILAALVVAYALSPIDLIPDFIPVLGYLDDLVLVPLGLALVVRTIPPPLLAEFRRRAEREVGHRRSWFGAAIVLLVWGLVMLWMVRAFLRLHGL